MSRLILIGIFLIFAGLSVLLPFTATAADTLQATHSATLKAEQTIKNMTGKLIVGSYEGVSIFIDSFAMPNFPRS